EDEGTADPARADADVLRPARGGGGVHVGPGASLGGLDRRRCRSADRGRVHARRADDGHACGAAARLAATTSIVRSYSPVGLNSTTSVPDVITGTWPGGA